MSAQGTTVGVADPRLAEPAVAVPLEEPVRRFSTGRVPIASDSEFSFDTASSALHSGVDTMSPCTPTVDGDGTVFAQAEPSDSKRKKHGIQAVEQEKKETETKKKKKSEEN